MDVFKNIPLRKSIRRYSNKEVDNEIISEAIEKAKDFIKLVPLKDVTFIPKKGNEISRTFVNAFGDYGKLLNAPLYIGLSTEKHYLQKMINTGFLGEQMIIYLTSLGLSTSWMASFEENVFNSAFDLEEGHILQALISVGYPSNDLQSKVINRIMGKTSGKRKKLKKLVFIDDIKNRANSDYLKEKDLLKVFEMARLAPSWHNVQPWYFILKENRVYLILKFDEARYKINAIHKKLFFHEIDMGIVMAHIAMAFKEMGVKGNWNLIPRQHAGHERKNFKMKPSDGIPFAYFEMEK